MIMKFNALSSLARRFAVLITVIILTTSGQSETPPMAGPGLTFWRFPVQPEQVTANRYDGYVPYEKFGKPLKAPRTLKSISKWEKAEGENAILTGYIQIDKPGTYGFRTGSGYDRNELLINGAVVCKFRDGENQGQTVHLPAGLLPIVSVAYVLSTKEVRVQWMPPGQTTWSDIPDKLLFHAKADKPN